MFLTQSCGIRKSLSDDLLTYFLTMRKLRRSLTVSAFELENQKIISDLRDL